MELRVRLSKECIVATVCFLPGLCLFYVGLYLFTFPVNERSDYVPFLCIGGFVVIFSTFYFLIYFQDVKNKVIRIKLRKNHQQTQEVQAIAVNIHNQLDNGEKEKELNL